MKKWLYVISLNIFLGISTAIGQSMDRIAIVNVANIFQQSPQRAIVAKQLENEFKYRATELQYMERDLQNKIQRLQQDGSRMRPDERNSLEKLVIAQRETFSEKAQEFEQDNRYRQTEERNKILNCIKNVVKNIAIQKGYDIVIDTSAIVYVNNITDITVDVMKQVQ